MGFEFGLVIFCVLAFLLLWQRTSDGGNGNGTDKHLESRVKAFEEARRSGETDLTFADWERRQQEAAIKVSEEKRKNELTEALVAGGVDADTRLLWDKMWELKSAKSALENEIRRNSPQRSFKSLRPPEPLGNRNELIADCMKRAHQTNAELETVLASLNSIRLKWDAEASAERRARLDQEFPGMPYRLQRHAPDPLTHNTRHWGYSLDGKPDPWSVVPNASGHWSATSTTWGLRSTVTAGVNKVTPLRATGLSQNSAIVNLFKEISERRDKVPLPFDPMDVDV